MSATPSCRTRNLTAGRRTKMFASLRTRGRFFFHLTKSRDPTTSTSAPKDHSGSRRGGGAPKTESSSPPRSILDSIFTYGDSIVFRVSSHGRFSAGFIIKPNVFLVPTNSIKKYLDGKGFKNVVVWDRGVELEKFPYRPDLCEENTIICVSRASKEKNIDDFCRLTGHKKIFVGGGPYLDELKQKYSDVEFVGNFPYDRIAEQYNRACVFVFPSWFDTFGIVNLEAMACGLPVAAYPAPGPVIWSQMDSTAGLIRTFSLPSTNALRILR